MASATRPLVLSDNVRTLGETITFHNELWKCLLLKRCTANDHRGEKPRRQRDALHAKCVCQADIMHIIAQQSLKRETDNG